MQPTGGKAVGGRWPQGTAMRCPRERNPSVRELVSWRALTTWKMDSVSFRPTWDCLGRIGGDVYKTLTQNAVWEGTLGSATSPVQERTQNRGHCDAMPT